MQVVILKFSSWGLREAGNCFWKPWFRFDSPERQGEGALRGLLPDVLESQRATQGRESCNIGEGFFFFTLLFARKIVAFGLFACKMINFSSKSLFLLVN